ncbi:MAG: ABC transporter ATP-binding protein [Chloroflexota bacterium]
MSDRALVELRQVTKHYPVGTTLLGRSRGVVHAVDDVSLDIPRGQVFGLVGESGCGKSTLGRILVRLQEATSGEVRFNGQDLTHMRGERLRRLRRDIQVVFQDPFGSLDPRQTVAEIVSEPLKAHGLASRAELPGKVSELLRMVGLDPSAGERRPHEFSGGQRQRISIARAIAPRPTFILADEAVSALDVSVQAQILNLFMDLQAELGLTYLFIAHGLNVVRHISDRVGVMYLGGLVEVASTEVLFDEYAHPYTAALISAILPPDPGRKRRRIVLGGEVPSPVNPPSGCRFHTRCPIVQQRCVIERPALRELRPGHVVACHFPISPARLSELSATRSDPRSTTHSQFNKED